MRLGVFPAVALILIARGALAESASPATPGSDRALSYGRPASEQAAAHQHFERALTWYRAGKYQQAVVELEAALARDPQGKDLVFNLSLVQEKLGDLSGAIHSLERFQKLEKDPLELDRALQTIERLKGARAELLAHEARKLTTTVRDAPCLPARVRGKLDGWVIGTGSLALASWLVGTVFAVRALAESGDQRDTALVAELALATGAISGAGSFALYFGRFQELSSRPALIPAPTPGISGARFELRY